MLLTLFKIFKKYYLEKLQVIPVPLTAPVTYVSFVSVQCSAGWSDIPTPSVQSHALRKASRSEDKGSAWGIHLI